MGCKTSEMVRYIPHLSLARPKLSAMIMFISSLTKKIDWLNCYLGGRLLYALKSLSSSSQAVVKLLKGCSPIPSITPYPCPRYLSLIPFSSLSVRTYTNVVS